MFRINNRRIILNRFTVITILFGLTFIKSVANEPQTSLPALDCYDHYGRPQVSQNHST